jgi:hypothetical protein
VKQDEDSYRKIKSNLNFNEGGDIGVKGANTFLETKNHLKAGGK